MYYFEDVASGAKCVFTSKEKKNEFLQSYISECLKKYGEVPIFEVEYFCEEVPVNPSFFTFWFE